MNMCPPTHQIIHQVEFQIQEVSKEIDRVYLKKKKKVYIIYYLSA